MKYGTIFRLCGAGRERFGFITDEIGETYFFIVHQAKVKAPLVEGARVRFDVEPVPDKPALVANGRVPKARSVEVIREAEETANGQKEI